MKDDIRNFAGQSKPTKHGCWSSIEHGQHGGQAEGNGSVGGISFSSQWVIEQDGCGYGIAPGHIIDCSDGSGGFVGRPGTHLKTFKLK